jgi:hypothetical protein
MENMSGLDRVSPHSAVAELKSIVFDQQKQIETLAALVDNMVIAYGKNHNGGDSCHSGSPHRLTKFSEVESVIYQYRLQLYVKVDEAVEEARLKLYEQNVREAARREAAIVQAKEDELGRIAAAKIALAQAKFAEDVRIAAAEKKEIVDMEQAIKFAEDVRIARREASRRDDAVKQNEKVDLAAKWTALEIEANAVAVTREHLEVKERELRARLAEARAVKAAPKKKATGKFNNIDNWSDAKCARMSEAWCE